MDLFRKEKMFVEQRLEGSKVCCAVRQWKAFSLYVRRSEQ